VTENYPQIRSEYYLWQTRYDAGKFLPGVIQTLWLYESSGSLSAMGSAVE
jgi:hypothetical protein